jgi:ligand-binding sensor domain-containing protein
MVKHFQEYALTNGFLLAEHTKQFFTTTELSNFFPDASSQSLSSNSTKSMAQARRGYLRCSPKSHGRTMF